MFTPRPQGATLRRAVEAMHRPHDPVERLDPNFMVAMRCEKCGKFAHGPRALMAEAIREHQESVCPSRHRNDGPQVMRTFFPRQ